MQAVDTLICAAHVVPVVPRGALAEHAVAVKDGRVVALLPTADALARFEAREVVRLDRHVLMPGLVNLHCHAAMTLMRGIADDVPLMTWLQQHVWPVEAKHVSDEFVHDGSMLGMAEMIRAGITCVNDMYFFPEATARAALRVGMRVAIGVIAIEFPSAYAPDAAGYLQKGLATRDAFRGEKLITFTLAPHAPYTVGDEMLKRMAVLAEEIDVPIHCHVHETKDEIAQGLAKDGVRPFERLRRLGVVGPRLIAVHSVHLDEAELDVMAREGVTVAHCPSSNRSSQAASRPWRLRKRGIRVGLGTDGAASNNRLDLFTEARSAALMAKAASGDASVIPAAEALEMATIEPARALGLDDRIGSIAPGKSADLVAVEFSSPETLPCYDPVSHLIYAAGREHVTHSWIDGRLRLDGRKLTGIDERDLEDKARWWHKRLTA
jgi:5-methylthioadenosine/S-adenosylhomocysteine deaminase